jgi:hypothetical protein
LDNAKIKERLQKTMDERYEQNGDIFKMSSPMDKAGALFGPPKPNHAAKVTVGDTFIHITQLEFSDY